MSDKNMKKKNNNNNMMHVNKAIGGNISVY